MYHQKMGMVALSICAVFLLPSNQASAAGDEKKPEVVGFGSNVTPDPSKKPVPVAGLGADLTVDAVQSTAPMVGLGRVQTSGAIGPVPGVAAAVPPGPQSGASGPYRNTKYEVRPSTAAAQKPAVPAKRNDNEGDGSAPVSKTPAVNFPKHAATLSDAKESMASLVKDYLRAHGKDGLKFESIDHGTFRALGRGRYSALVLLRDATGRHLQATAKTDMSGNVWKVTSLSTGASGKKTKKKK